VVKVRFRYVIEDVDRHGNVRLYFRQKGHPKRRLPGLPGSEEFLQAYSAALHSSEPRPRTAATLKGSFGHLCKAYYASATFKALDASTQSWRRRALDAICEQHGDKPIARMQSKHVRMLRDEKANTPGAARNRLKALRALFRWGLEAGEATNDPTRDVKPLPHRSEGHHSWTADQVRAFEDRHPVSSKARLAMALLLYTACRREDVVRLGPQHVRGGRVRYRQAKNEHRNPIDVDIPLHPDLSAIINATLTRHLTFLVTEYGKPFSAAGFGGKFREWCDEAGLPHCSAHGLRKATASRLAERGATAHEIMAVTGHQSLAEVERYTRAARKVGLADIAMSKLKG
jgi:integrase/recombinase XerD